MVLKRTGLFSAQNLTALTTFNPEKGQLWDPAPKFVIFLLKFPGTSPPNCYTSSSITFLSSCAKLPNKIQMDFSKLILRKEKRKEFGRQKCRQQVQVHVPQVKNHEFLNFLSSRNTSTNKNTSHDYVKVQKRDLYHLQLSEIHQCFLTISKSLEAVFHISD